MTTAEGVLERAVQHGGAHVQKGLHRGSAPAHLLGFGHAPSDDLVHRALTNAVAIGSPRRRRAAWGTSVASLRPRWFSRPVTRRRTLSTPATSRTVLRSVQRCRAVNLCRHPGWSPCHRCRFARSKPRTVAPAERASAVPAPRPRATCNAGSKRTAACHRSSTTMASGSTSCCRCHSPVSPSHGTVAGVFAPTPAGAPRTRAPGRRGRKRSGAGRRRRGSSCPRPPRSGGPLPCAGRARSRRPARPQPGPTPVPRAGSGNSGDRRRALARPPQRPVAHRADVQRPAERQQIGQRGSGLRTASMPHTGPSRQAGSGATPGPRTHVSVGDILTLC